MSWGNLLERVSHHCWDWAARAGAGLGWAGLHGQELGLGWTAQEGVARAAGLLDVGCAGLHKGWVTAGCIGLAAQGLSGCTGAADCWIRKGCLDRGMFAQGCAGVGWLLVAGCSVCWLRRGWGWWLRWRLLGLGLGLLCFNGWCINLWARYNFSKEAIEKAGEITKFEGTQFESLSYRPPASEIVSFSSSKIFTRLESRKTKVKEIMNALDDKNINVIGICGMRGVGKTTIVEEVFRQANAEKKFNKIVWTMVVVSQAPNVTKIQDEVAHKLDLQFENRDKSERVSALRVRINMEKKILVILNDVWNTLELEEVGIPFGEDHKGCKILLTSRSQDVCSEMGAQKTFPIQLFSELEAWVLFREMVGAAADSSDLNSMATEVAKRCGGLPIAIVTVGRALRNRSKHVWIDVLRQLKKPVPKRIKGMDAFLYSHLKLSYNYLEGEEAKSLFLLCSLFPEDDEIEVETLVQYGIGLRLFRDVDTIQDGRVRARALVSTLLSSFLLLKAEDDDFVKMHDLVRGAAIDIASKEENKTKYMVQAGVGLRDWLNPEIIYQTYTGISLMSIDIRGLPDGLECPKLQTLLLQKNSCQSNLEIPPNFFQGMKDLKVLDMSLNKILSLPPSISLLATLRTLNLVGCQLGDISFIGTLKQLEILDLSESNIQVVLGDFTQLTHLRLFDLRDCNRLMQIAPGVISSLCKLEELYFNSNFTNWAVEGEREEENSRTSASLAKLKSLSQLTRLFLVVPNADLLPHDLKLQNLTRFSIAIGHPYPEPIFEKNLSLTFDTRLSGRKGFGKENRSSNFKQLPGFGEYSQGPRQRRF
ncbi:LOW QUALITY PROTEIN: disease resistance protein At4g27190-like [Actinidia eriantha]|uniref:LOW QUALITY PROTEIN: disease resistance protein At4g27190-like n=1 Tax=Actinidia eriantha TaxID=165200 RepID=UPI0025852D01|nr:LOW QUALITY PROTEIN: disease resistance protein At4g27190-like [Actinidia eriantha]